MSRASIERKRRSDDARMAHALVQATGIEYATADLAAVAQYRITECGNARGEPATFLRINRRAIRLAIRNAQR